MRKVSVLQDTAADTGSVLLLISPQIRVIIWVPAQFNYLLCAKTSIQEDRGSPWFR